MPSLQQATQCCGSGTLKHVGIQQHVQHHAYLLHTLVLVHEGTTDTVHALTLSLSMNVAPRKVLACRRTSEPAVDILMLQHLPETTRTPTFARQCHGYFFCALLLQSVDDATGPLPFWICPFALF